MPEVNMEFNYYKNIFLIISDAKHRLFPTFPTVLRLFQFGPEKISHKTQQSVN